MCPRSRRPWSSGCSPPGAILIGKTNLDQFATGLVGVRTPYPVPKNALDPDLVPGGSSSGSAVAVARGLVSFALGTDTAGSGRVPAALNNIVGLKPSLGAISTRGVVPACRTLDCVSIFAGSVGDAWRVYEVAAAFDRDDPFSKAWPRVGTGTGAQAPASVFPDLREAASSAAGIGGGCLRRRASRSPRGIAATRIANRPLARSLRSPALLYEGAWVAERYAAIREFVERKPEALLPITRKIIEGARALSAADAFDGRYRLAELARQCEAAWDEIDILVVPSIPDVCTLAEVGAVPIGANRGSAPTRTSSTCSGSARSRSRARSARTDGPRE